MNGVEVVREVSHLPTLFVTSYAPNRCPWRCAVLKFVDKIRIQLNADVVSIVFSPSHEGWFVACPLRSGNRWSSPLLSEAPMKGTGLPKVLKKHRLSEPEIKAIVLNRLKEQGRIDRRSTLASEFCLGRTGVRADLAIRSDRLIGVEIKSELDSLRRLPAQLSVYRAYFATSLLVVATRHLDGIASNDLTGVEVWECMTDGTVRTVRDGATGGLMAEPEWASLMTQVERRRFLAEETQASHEVFRAAFDYRFGMTSSQFWRAVGRRRIRADDLGLLSRFRDLRLTSAAMAEARNVEWAEFVERARLILERTTPTPAKPSQAA